MLNFRFIQYCKEIGCSVRLSDAKNANSKRQTEAAFDILIELKAPLKF